MHKAVIFDLGRVLINFDFQRGYRTLETLCPYTTAEIRSRLAASGIVQQFETGLIEPTDFVDRFNSCLDLAIPYGRFCEIWSSIFSETLVPDEMIAGLAARYPLILLSNTNAIHFEMVRSTYPILRHFHHLVLSHEVKAMKPRREIYQAAVDRAGCRPEECFYTDDIAEYVAAARDFGIDAVQFQSAAQIQQELRTRGITW